MPAYRRELLADETYVLSPPARSGRLRVALLFPGEYAVGMANLAVQTLHALLTAHPDVLAERAFYPVIPEEGRPHGGVLRSLEEDTALGAFDVIAISSSFELDWLNIPAALREGGIEPFAAERSSDRPLVIIGGPAVTANPEPLAPFADALFIGEVEPVLAASLDALLAHSGDRDATLAALAALPGWYVPALATTAPIARVALADLDAAPTTTSILTPRSEFPRTFLIETGRGCPRGCRFCLARRIYHPVRARSADAILASARVGLRFTERIGLVGAGVADHPQIEEIATEIVALGGAVSTSSLRAEGVTPGLMAALARGGQRSMTLAPETADEDLARTIGKRVSFEAVREAVAMGRAAGISEVKLYFMVGIPGETDEAALAIADFVERLQDAVPDVRITVAIGPLVPKPHTDLARVAVPDPATVGRRLKRLQRRLRRRTRADVRTSSARGGAVQTVLGRGGRELAPVIAAAAGGGPGDFTRALAAEGLTLEDYLSEQEGPMPWEVVGECVLLGVSR